MKATELSSELQHTPCCSPRHAAARGRGAGLIPLGHLEEELLSFQIPERMLRVMQHGVCCSMACAAAPHLEEELLSFTWKKSSSPLHQHQLPYPSGAPLAFFTWKKSSSNDMWYCA
jgi:hypothetical protein